MNARSTTRALLLSLAACHASTPETGPATIDFDGPEPSGWSAASTGGTGAHATWQRRADSTAPSAPNVLALVSANHASAERFNLFWSAGPRFGDGRLAVRVRADGGAIDQGGGPMWRVQSADDYYLCRINPLEANYRVYVVKDGVRRQLASAPAELAAGRWQRLEVEHVGAHITCWLDGQKLLEASDDTLPDAGGVGLWTKADALTSFDDLELVPAK